MFQNTCAQPHINIHRTQKIQTVKSHIMGECVQRYLSTPFMDSCFPNFVIVFPPVGREGVILTLRVYNESKGVK